MISKSIDVPVLRSIGAVQDAESGTELNAALVLASCQKQFSLWVVLVYEQTWFQMKYAP